jgi:Xaa-Pro aminopeptidase
MQRVQKWLRDEGAPVAFVFDPANICYLTGYWTILSGIPGSETLLVVPASGAPFLAVPGLEVTLGQEQCPGLDIRYLRPTEGRVGGRARPAQTVGQLVTQTLSSAPSGAPVGVDASLMRADRHAALMAQLRGRPVKDLTPWLSAQRASKDAVEQQRIRAGARIVVEAADAIARALRPGVTEQALASEAVRTIWARGGTISHLVVAGGPRAALPHALPTARPVGAGEFLVVDIGVFHEHYWAEIARTYVAGAASKEQLRLIDLVRGAQTAARETLKAGVRACDVDEAARAVLRDAGFDDGVYIHSTGHGLGIMGMDAPAVAPHNTAPIPLNAALTIEPGLYFSGSGGIRIEDSFLVGESGGESLTD